MIKKSIVLLFLLINSGAIFCQQTIRFINTRYGFEFIYPAELKQEVYNRETWSVKFTDSLSFEMIVSVMANPAEQKIDYERNESEGWIDKITFRSRGDNWYALSGYKDEKIIYYKGIIKGNKSIHLHISYPVNTKRKYDDWIELIALTLTANR